MYFKLKNTIPSPNEPNSLSSTCQSCFLLDKEEENYINHSIIKQFLKLLISKLTKVQLKIYFL